MFVLLVLLCGALDLASGSTPAMCGIETCEELRRSVNNNYHAIAKVEVRDRSELARLIKREIMVGLKEVIKKEIKDELKEVIKKGIEDELKEMIRKEIKEELEDWAARQEEQTLAEVRVAVEVLKVRINETEDLARSCLASQRHSEEAVRKNLSLSSAEVLKTLTDHTSEFRSIDTRLSRVENRCSGPPHVENGHPMDSGLGGRADHEDVVTYACRGDKVPAGNDKMRCLHGEWTGEIPRCVDPVCTPPCENGGKCIKNDTCRCPPSFTGDRCQNDACGLDSRNVGGNSSSGAPSRPWMAALHWKGDSEVRCTGSIIHRSFILTNALCVHNNIWKPVNATDLTVGLGSTDTGDLTHRQEHNVRTIHVHPLFGTSTPLDVDIALLELEKPIDYDLFVGPVCLPTRETPEDNRVYEPQSSVHAIGWAGYGSSYTLREYPAVIQPRDVCDRKYREMYEWYLPDRMFCAAPSGAAGCPSEGWAAVQSRPDGRGGLVWTQVGVGGYCLTDSGYSSGDYYIFSRLQHLVPWIEETVGAAAP